MSSKKKVVLATAKNKIFLKPVLKKHTAMPATTAPTVVVNQQLADNQYNLEELEKQRLVLEEHAKALKNQAREIRAQNRDILLHQAKHRVTQLTSDLQEAQEKLDQLEAEELEYHLDQIPKTEIDQVKNWLQEFKEIWNDGGEDFQEWDTDYGGCRYVNVSTSSPDRYMGLRVSFRSTILGKAISPSYFDIATPESSWYDSDSENNQWREIAEMGSPQPPQDIEELMKKMQITVKVKGEQYIYIGNSGMARKDWEPIHELDVTWGHPQP